MESRGLLVNRRLDTPGGLSDYRLPDYRLPEPNYPANLPQGTLGVWDLKPLNLNEYSYYLSSQFTDIREVTGVSPVPLYYKLRLPGL